MKVSVMVLIFTKVVGKKPAILLKYEPLADVLQTLSLDNKNTCFPEQPLAFDMLPYIKEVGKRPIKIFFVSRTTTKKINMLKMCKEKQLNIKNL